MDTSDGRGEGRHDASDQQGTLSRREVMRRGAVIGGAAAWAVPTVQTIGLRAAGAATGTPQPACCHSSAFGLRVQIPALGIDETFGVGGCLADTGQIGDPATASVRATAVCGNTDNSDGGPCEGTASIATLEVIVGEEPLTGVSTLEVAAETLTSQASAPCAPGCGTTGGATIQSLTVNGDGVTVTGTCNFDVLGAVGLGSLGEITFNRQQCEGDTLNVDSLYLNVLDTILVSAAHSEAGADNCGCQEC